MRNVLASIEAVSARGSSHRREAELLVLDEVIRELAERSDGEEPLHPECRALLDETKQRILALVKDLPLSFGELLPPSLRRVCARCPKR